MITLRRRMKASVRLYSSTDSQPFRHSSLDSERLAPDERLAGLCENGITLELPNKSCGAQQLVESGERRHVVFVKDLV